MYPKLATGMVVQFIHEQYDKQVTYLFGQTAIVARVEDYSFSVLREDGSEGSCVLWAGAVKVINDDGEE